MSAIRCINPGCGGTDTFAVRPVYEWHRGFRWARFWRGVHVYRKEVGAGVVCCRCDTAAVVTDTDGYLTQASLRKMGVTPLVPMGQARAEREAAERPGYRAVTLEP